MNARRRTPIRKTTQRKARPTMAINTSAFAAKKGAARSVQQRRKVKTRAEQGYKSCRKPVSTAGTAPLRIRALMLAFFLCCGFSAVGVQLGQVALVPAQEPRISIRELPVAPIKRGNIYDDNGVLLATTLAVPSLYIDPQRVLNKTETLAKLHTIIPDLHLKKLARLVNHPKRRFVWAKRQITPEQAFQVNQLGLPGVGFRSEHVRVYPQHRLAAHVLGGTGVDGKGLAGIELARNEELQYGEDVYLTLDARLQKQLANSLAYGMELSGATGGWGVVLDAQTGDVKALASLPDYTPNTYGNSPKKATFNPITFGRFEMGSTFKLFTLAQGLAEGHITTQTEIDARYPLKIGKFTIKDFHAKKRILTAQEVLRYSSNIGAATIAQMYGGKAQQAFFRNLGLMDVADIGLPETIGPSYSRTWGTVHTITASYGHGIAVTPLQLAAAAAVLATDGTYRPPRLLKDEAYGVPRQVVAAHVMPDIKFLMRDVVQEGSGRRTKTAGLDIGGKTGTAEKIGGTGYSEDKNLVSFVGAVPLDNPKFVALIMLDEPKKGFETAGRSAVPTFKHFLDHAAPMLALAPTDDVSPVPHVLAQR